MSHSAFYLNAAWLRLQRNVTKFLRNLPIVPRKWNESGFRPPLCTYRLNWARRTSWGWWDDWDDTVLQTQDSKFEPWRSEAEHATSRSRRLPTILTFTRGWGRNNFCFFQTAETGNRTPDSGVKGSGANHYPRAPAHCAQGFRCNWRSDPVPNRVDCRWPLLTFAWALLLLSTTKAPDNWDKKMELIVLPRGIPADCGPVAGQCRASTQEHSVWIWRQKQHTIHDVIRAVSALARPVLCQCRAYLKPRFQVPLFCLPLSDCRSKL